MIRALAGWFLAIAPVIAFASINLWSQAFYTHRSLGSSTDTSSAFSEVPEASRLNVDTRLHTLASNHKNTSSVIVSDTSNLILAKMYGTYFAQDTMSFPAYDYWSMGNYAGDSMLQFLRLRPIVREAILLSNARRRHLLEKDFVFRSQLDATHQLRTSFIADEFEFDFPASKSYLTNGSRESVMNRFGDSDRETLRLETSSSVRNRIIFVNSSLGKSYAFGEEPEAFFQLEPDYFYRGRTMAGIGRYLLCRVENPSEKIRIVLWISTSLKGDDAPLPPISIIGQTRVPAVITGRGSGRVISEPVVPRIIDGGAYVLIDMGAEATAFKPRDYGFFFNLYHREIELDHRKLTAFARDISAIDEKTYRETSRLSSFQPNHGDLLNEAALYSGFYEDGWVSDSATLQLHSAVDDNELHLQGSVPLTSDPNFETTLKVSIDGQLLATRNVGLGPFDIHVPIQPVEQARDISITSSRTQKLPGADGRTVGAYIYRVAFDSSKDITDAAAEVSIGNGWYPIEHFAGQTFRWFASDAKLEITSAVARQATLSLDIAGGPGLYGNGTLTVTNDAGIVVLRTPLSDRRTVAFPVDLSENGSVYTLTVSGGGKKIASDPRILNARVFKVHLTL